MTNASANTSLLQWLERLAEVTERAERHADARPHSRSAATRAHNLRGKCEYQARVWWEDTRWPYSGTPPEQRPDLSRRLLHSVKRVPYPVPFGC
jgi:hypothetical protein